MALPAAALEFTCLQYGPIQIAGTLVQHTYAGPPDYESVTKGDRPLTVWKLQLDERICVDANTRYPREAIQIEIELALDAGAVSAISSAARAEGPGDRRAPAWRRQPSKAPGHRAQHDIQKDQPRALTGAHSGTVEPAQ